HDLPPSGEDIGVVVFGFGDRAYAIGENEGFLEIPKAVLFGEMVIVNQLPAATQLRVVGVEFLTPERRHSTLARNAVFCRKHFTTFEHGISLKEREGASNVKDPGRADVP